MANRSHKISKGLTIAGVTNLGEIEVAESSIGSEMLFKNELRSDWAKSPVSLSELEILAVSQSQGRILKWLSSKDATSLNAIERLFRCQGSFKGLSPPQSKFLRMHVSAVPTIQCASKLNAEQDYRTGAICI